MKLAGHAARMRMRNAWKY